MLVVGIEKNKDRKDQNAENNKEILLPYLIHWYKERWLGEKFILVAELMAADIHYDTRWRGHCLISPHHKKRPCRLKMQVGLWNWEINWRLGKCCLDEWPLVSTTGIGEHLATTLWDSQFLYVNGCVCITLAGWSWLALVFEFLVFLLLFCVIIYNL